MSRRRNGKEDRCGFDRCCMQCRQQEGAFNMLMADLRSDDIELYEGFTRMSPEHFDELLVI